ncbi:hypothetical protein JOB18_039802, partial [Solea senegalensis]
LKIGRMYRLVHYTEIYFFHVPSYLYVVIQILHQLHLHVVLKPGARIQLVLITLKICLRRKMDGMCLKFRSSQPHSSSKVHMWNPLLNTVLSLYPGLLVYLCSRRMLYVLIWKLCTYLLMGSLLLSP